MLYQLSYSRTLSNRNGGKDGEGRIRTSVGYSQQIYSLPSLTA